MKPTYIFIHHTLVSHKKNPKQWKATDNYHKSQWPNFKSSLGYWGGYNYEIAADGTVHQFRQDGEATAAQYQKNMNDGRAISICLDGNFDIEMPTEAQMKATRELIQLKMKQYGIKRENIWHHRDVAAYKSCPGKNIPEDVASFFLGGDYPQPVKNSLELSLYRDRGNGRLYLVKELYYPIADEQTFNVLFGSFQNARWAEGDTPPAEKIGKLLNLK